MSDNKNNRRSFNAKGYYIALILCAAAIGISGYLYYQNTRQQEKPLLLEQEQTQPQMNLPDRETQVLEAIATEPALPDTTAPTAAASEPAQTKPLKTAAPVSGEALTGYAMDCLSYNETTRDWRVHNGVDLAAPQGSPVTAAADGTVVSVFEDDSLGHTVVVRHAGGYETRYASLDRTLEVCEGEQVTLGQTLGYVGDSALVETALGPHVHFSVTFRDAPMDPGEFLTLGE